MSKGIVTHNDIRKIYKTFTIKKYFSNISKLFLKYFKGSLHIAIFSKYTELLRLKNIFRMFWNSLWNILEINAFQNKNVKSAVIF